MEANLKTGRKKQLPPFYQTVTKGHRYEQPVNNPFRLAPNPNGDISPYSNYIPLMYFYNENTRLSRMSMPSGDSIKAYMDILYPDVEKNTKTKERALRILSTSKITNYAWTVYADYGDEVTRKNIKRLIKDHRFDDQPLSLTSFIQNTIFEKCYIKGAFEDGSGHLGSFGLPKYEGVAGFLTLIQRRRLGDNSTEYFPHVLPVVLPEYYIYQKLHIMLRGTIDLSKVVVLVNRELDDPQFHIPSMRNFYKKELEPILLDTACTVFKVPLDFIQENCFIGPYKLQSKNIVERKKELHGLVEKFYEANCVKEEDPWTTLEPAEAEGSWSISVGNYVAGIDTTSAATAAFHVQQVMDASNRLLHQQVAVQEGIWNILNHPENPPDPPIFFQVAGDCYVTGSVPQ